METFRVYTQDTNRDFIKALFARHFESCTLFTGQGIWQGSEEFSLCAEVITNDVTTPSKLETIAAEIKRVNKQDAVLVTRHSITAKLL